MVVQCLIEEISSMGILCCTSAGGLVQTPLENRLLMFLWYMASSDKYVAIANRSGTSEITALYAIHNLITFINVYLSDAVVQSFRNTGNEGHVFLIWFLGLLDLLMVHTFQLKVHQTGRLTITTERKKLFHSPASCRTKRSYNLLAFLLVFQERFIMQEWIAAYYTMCAS